MELRDILAILWRRRWSIINIFAAIFLTIVIGTLLITPWYDATAKVLLRKSAASSALLSSIGLSGSSSQTAISTTDQADYLVLSTVKPVIERIVAELHVTRERTRARIMRAIPLLKPVLRVLGVDVEAVTEVMTAEELIDSPILSYIFPRPYVSVEQYEETDILEITATSPDPEQAMQIANAVAKAFIENELMRAREDYKGVKGFIDENIEKAKQEYSNALQAVTEFKEKEKTTNLDTETTDLLQKISDLKKSMEDNNLAMHKIKASTAQVESQLRSLPKYQKISEQIASNEIIKSLKITLGNLYIDLADTKTKYTKDHPSVMDIENKIAQTKDLMQKEVEKVFGSETVGIDPVYQDLSTKLAGYYAEMAGYEAQNQVFPRIINKYEAELMDIPRKGSIYSRLALAVTVTQDIYNSLLKYQYQAGMAESIALSNIYMVESAITPSRDDSKHRSPSLFLDTIVAILLGTTFGIGMTLLIEYMDVTIRTPEDIKAFKTLTFLGSIFRLKRKESKLINTKIDLRAPLKETFRAVRNSIKFATLDKPLKIFTVTSSVQGEGKSFFAANISISMANEGKRVLLIDGDLIRPSIHTLFQTSNSPGLTNFLSGEKGLSDIKFPTHTNGLDIMTTGPLPPDSGKLVESQKMRQLIIDMGKDYDIVVVDTAPILASSDAIVLGGYADGMVMIVESAQTTRSILTHAIEEIKKANINLLGAVLNKVKELRTSYYSYYYYGGKK